MQAQKIFKQECLQKTFFIIEKQLKQFKYPSWGQMFENYAVFVQRNTMLINNRSKQITHALNMDEPANIMLNEWSQIQKIPTVLFDLNEVLEQANQSMVINIRSVDALCWEPWRDFLRQLIYSIYWLMWWLHGTQEYIFAKTHFSVHLMFVHFIKGIL